MGISNKKVFIELERSNNTTENFRFGFGRLLKIIGCEHRFGYIKEIKEEDLNWCDVYIAVRPNTPMSLSIAQVIKDSGRPYIVFFDDDLLYRADSIKRRNESSKACLKLSDCVFGANPALCEDYGRFSKRYFSINTAVEESELSNPTPDSSQIQIVYAAGKDHASIYERIVKPAMRQLIEEYETGIHFTFVGVEPRVEDIGNTNCFSFIPLMPLSQYTEYMRSHHFDIGLAPLEDNRFSNMKYFNKYIEYSKSAIIGIYSNVKPYTYAVRDGENGYLVSNDDVSWYERLKYCLDNITESREIGKRAQEDLKDNYSLGAITLDLENNLSAVITDKSVKEIRWSQHSLREKLFYFEDKMGKLLQHTRNRGIKETIRVIQSRNA